MRATISAERAPGKEYVHLCETAGPSHELRAGARWRVRRFDARALYEALEQKRAARGLRWVQVAEETGVSDATLRRTREGGRLEVDGMLAMVAWLGVPVETFVREIP